MSRLRGLDPALLTNAVALCLVGWLAVYSATGFSGLAHPARQALHMGIGFLLMAVFAVTDYRRVCRLGMPLYLLSLVLLGLVLVPGIGQLVNGSRRWIGLGPLGAFQPSELAKLAVILVLARLFAGPPADPEAEDPPPEVGGRFVNLVLGLALAGLPFLMIAKQPDLGTGLVVLAGAGAILFVGGASPIYLAGLVTAALALAPHVLKEYQRNRLLIFMNPDLDPQGMGYSLLQSRTAVGSGGFWGKGLFSGYMTQLGFVPENWTDFVFSAIGEELGYLGACGLLLLCALLLFRIAWTAAIASDRLGSLLCVGVMTMLGFQMVVNVAMTIGLAPVVGIPLPFASFGGTAVMVNLACLGLVMSVRARARG